MFALNTAHAAASTSDGPLLVFLSTRSFCVVATVTYSFDSTNAAARVITRKYGSVCGEGGRRRQGRGQGAGCNCLTGAHTAGSRARAAHLHGQAKVELVL